MKISLLIAIYRRVDFLEKILASLLHQTQMPDEIIICEDGEYPEVSKLLKQWERKLPFKIIHITQKDMGNRKTLCVNKGILASNGDYIITIDGDCVLHPDFINQHILHADTKSFLTGRRVELSQEASENLSAVQIENGYLNGIPTALMLDAIFGKTHHLGRFFITPKYLRLLLSQNSILDIRGCNFSTHKKHLISINGYNNNFSGAYGEDSDLELRLKNLGLKMKSVRGAAIQYHLWHKEQAHDQGNQTLLKQSIKEKMIKAPNGLKEAAHL